MSNDKLYVVRLNAKIIGWYVLGGIAMPRIEGIYWYLRFRLHGAIVTK